MTTDKEFDRDGKKITAAYESGYAAGYEARRQDESLSIVPHKQGIHVFFDNGYGLSIQRNQATYTDKHTFEVAVIHGNVDKWEICYRTPVNSDLWAGFTDVVIGWVTGEQLVDLMLQTQALTRNLYCSHTVTR